MNRPEINKSNTLHSKPQYKWPKTLNNWIDLITRTQDHEVKYILQDLILWKAYTGGFWNVDWDKFYKKLHTLLTKESHIPSYILNKEYYKRYVNKAILTTNKARNKNWGRYTSRLILSHQDVLHINERYLSTLEPPKAENATLMIDGDLGTGKSKWFYNNTNS